MSAQYPNAVVMIRPNNFTPNPETATDNRFQTIPNMPSAEISRQAQTEFDSAVSRMNDAGVRVHAFQDRANDTPDSVFPNNWFSTHHEGHVAIYPMYAKSRRKERRTDVIEFLKQEYRVSEVTGFSGFEADGLSLEGTGAMVLDHIGRLACATVGLDMVSNAERGQTISERLSETGRDVIALSESQIGEFAGNAIELTGTNGPVLALSSQAERALAPDQRRRLEGSLTLLPLDLPIIESAGGSARCMIAGIHLAPRAKRNLN